MKYLKPGAWSLEPKLIYYSLSSTSVTPPPP
jgi:hypothetical protein